MKGCLKTPIFEQIIDDPKVIFRVLEEDLEASELKFDKIVTYLYENCK